MYRIISILVLLIAFLGFFLTGCFISECIGGEYNRAEQFGGWIDIDSDGQNTRNEVLIRDSLIPVTFDSNGNVNFGLWKCRYTGTITTYPRDFDIDHLVPLKEAYVSGADHWTDEKRIRYANYLKDPDHLVAVTLGSNRSKGPKDIAEWLPLLNEKEYIEDWIKTKEEWGLCFDIEELVTIILKTPNLVVPNNPCFSLIY
jgi:hypothetical protein